MRKKTHWLFGVSLDCKFYNERSEFLSSTWHSKVFDFKIIDDRYKDDDFLFSYSLDCIILCKDCYSELKQWLEIPVHDSIDLIE